MKINRKKGLDNNTKQKPFIHFILSREFTFGLVVGAVIATLVGYSPIFAIWIQLQMDPITIDDCEYGLHQDFFGARCITHSEMQEHLGCENFYLRDGYWWECI